MKMMIESERGAHGMYEQGSIVVRAVNMDRLYMFDRDEQNEMQFFKRKRITWECSCIT